MAEALVKATDAIHPDPVVDQMVCYKAGMVVDVKPDGFDWGGCLNNDQFFIVKLPSVPVEAVNKYLEPQVKALADGLEVVRVRKWVLDWGRITAASQARLLSGTAVVKSSWYNGPADFDWSSQVKLLMKDQETGASEVVDL